MPEPKYNRDEKAFILGNSKYLYTRTTRGEGQALNKMFHNALISYRGAVWHVTEYHNQTQLPISEQEWKLLREKIVDAAHPYQKKSELIYPDESSEIRIIEPSIVELGIPEKMQFFRCSRMGHVFTGKTIEEIDVCPKCGDENTVQLPIFIKKYTNKTAGDGDLSFSDPHTIYSNISSPQVPQDSKLSCSTCHQERRLIQKSAYQPIASLVWICDNCHKEMPFRRPYKSRNYYFKIDAAYDSLFRGLTARQTTINSLETLSDATNIMKSEINFLKNVSFSSSLSIYDACFGCVSNNKFFYFSSGNQRTIYARKFNTKGIVFEFDNKIFDESKRMIEENISNIPSRNAREKLEQYFLADELTLKISILHTFKHIMLSNIPLLFGIEVSKMSGDYSYRDEAKVILFDNENGGIGVSESLTTDLTKFARWINISKKSSSNCNRDPYCSGACKLCSFIENCGILNRDINRYLLYPIFNIDFKSLKSKFG